MHLTFHLLITFHLYWFKHPNSYHLLCTWIGCIRSCTKDTSHGFLTRWWTVHSKFIDLGNLVETIVHYLIIGVFCLGYWDEVPMVSTLVCMITHWIYIGPIMNHDLSYPVVMIHQTTILHRLWTLRGYWAYIEINKRLFT